MKIAGGILAILGGLIALALYSAIQFLPPELFLGQDRAEQLLKVLSWIGVGASIAAVLLGVALFFSRNRLPAVLLIISSIFGAVFGAGIGSLFLLLATIGGVIALFGKYKPAKKEPIEA